MPCSKTAKSIFSAALIAIACTLPARAATLIDATGAKVNVSDRPMRIVTLIPSLAELAADLLAAELDRIVGVSMYTDYPPALKKRESIGPYDRFNLEKVASLKPDLVLASMDGNPKDQVLHLRELGLPVVIVSTETLDQVADSMKLVGAAIGNKAEGERMARQFSDGLKHIREKAATRKSRPRVLLQLGENPLVVAGRRTFLHEAIAIIGAENVYGDNSNRYPRPSIEDVIRHKPDMILVMALGDDTPSFEAMARGWLAFPTIPAVVHRKVSVFRADPLIRPSLRLLEGLSLLSKRVHDGQ